MNLFSRRNPGSVGDMSTDDDSIRSAAAQQGAAGSASEPRPAGRGRLAAYAERLFDEQPQQAYRLVAPLFTGRDPTTTAIDLDLADAAIIFVLSWCEEHDSALDVAWAAYARKANQLLRDERDPRTWRATEALASAYTLSGRHAEAAEVWQQLTGVYERIGMPGDRDEARLEWAATLHGLGRCGEAIRLAGQSWASWCAPPKADFAVGAAIAHWYCEMLRLCDRRLEADVVAAQAIERLPAHCGPASLTFAIFRPRASLNPPMHESVCARHTAELGLQAGT